MRYLYLLLTIALVACSAPVSQTPISPVPTNPQTQAVQSPAPVEGAQRVVALTSLSADILQRLDKTRLVGIPGSRLLRQNPAFAQLPQVSEGQTPPNLEKIVALKPDLVVGAAGFHDQTIAKLKSLGIPTLVTEVNSWQALENVTKQLAAAIQADPEPLLNQYRSLLPSNPAPGTSTLVLVSQQPILSPNKASWAGDLLQRFGAKNLAAELQGQSPIGGYITLSAEKVLEANPDVVIVVDADQQTLNALKSQAFWSKLRAVQQNRIYVLDYYGLVNPGSLSSIESVTTQLRCVIPGDQETCPKPLAPSP